MTCKRGPAGLVPEVVQAVRAGDTIGAIKLHRAHTGDGLKEAKAYVDRLKASVATGG